MQSLSVIILTRNEEALIERAIASTRTFADEVVVVDSCSSDRTPTLAKEAGAVVIVQEWLGWVEQRRKGASAARNDWVFFMEADEIATPRLAASIREALAGDPDPDIGFVLDREDEFLGRLMFNMRRRSKRASFVRIYNRTRSDWRRDMLIHEEVSCPGPRVALAGALLHWRNYTIKEQMDVYNRYSDLESAELMRKGEGLLAVTVICKPVLRFLWIYVKCGNWRLGMRGFLWSGMNALAEFLRLAKTWEAVHAPRAVDPPASIYRGPDQGEPPDRGLTLMHPSNIVH